MNVFTLKNYLEKLSYALDNKIDENIENLYSIINKKVNNKDNIFICGNGGSAANSIHIANDFIYLNNRKKSKKKINVESLCANTAIITCIANDIDYKDIFSFQLATKAKKDDLLIVLSGSGNSQNILEAIKVSKKIGLSSFGILGYNGGEAKKNLDNFIHFKINDMQIVEDLQTIVFHLILKKFLGK